MKRTELAFGILTITVVLTTQALAQSFLNNGLVAYYPFTGSANDASGNGNNGTVYGAVPTTNRFGVANSAYYFNGTTDYIQIGDISDLRMTNYLTVSAWINPVNTNEAQMIVSKEGEYWLATINGMLVCALANSNSTVFYEYFSTSQINTSLWTQVAMDFDQGALTLWVNGTAITNFSVSSQIGRVTAIGHDLRIGDRQQQQLNSGGQLYNEWFTGAIDDIRIYDIALSSNEVQELYQYESAPQVAILQAVVPSFSNLYIGTNYQLQVSSDLNTWTNSGSAFTATNSTMIYPQYFNVANWNQLFFRIQETP
jgi:hypothetical protein